MSELDSNPRKNQGSGALVRNALFLLAVDHPSIKPDDIVALHDDLLDWNKLVEIDFPLEWRASAERMQTEGIDIIREDGVRRLKTCYGTRTLEFLVKDARQDSTALDDLRCAAIIIGNLIEDQIANRNPELARVIQLQINSLYNASTNQAFVTAGFGGIDGKVGTILPEYKPKIPDLKLDDE